MGQVFTCGVCSTYCMLMIELTLCFLGGGDSIVCSNYMYMYICSRVREHVLRVYSRVSKSKIVCITGETWLLVAPETAPYTSEMLLHHTL